MPGHDARVRYSLATNVNTPFSQVPTLEIGHKRGHRIRVQIVFVQSSEAAISLCSVLSSCFKMMSDSAKWSNYEHRNISGTEGVNTPLFCASTQALIPEHQARTASSFMHC